MKHGIADALSYIPYNSTSINALTDLVENSF